MKTQFNLSGLSGYSSGLNIVPQTVRIATRRHHALEQQRGLRVLARSHITSSHRKTSHGGIKIPFSGATSKPLSTRSFI